VVNGGDDDVPVLTALAVAESIELGQRATVTVAVRRAVLARLIEFYSKVAASNYAKVAKKFDGVAANFTDVAGCCDPEGDAASMVEAPDETRASWLNAAIFANKLDRVVPIVRAAASLANVPSSAHRDLGVADACLLPLVCDPGELHRRRVWEAFATKGRCGRWSALTALGATIRAWPATELDSFQPYSQPRPLERRVRPAGDGFHSFEEFAYALEDTPQQEPQPVKPRRAPSSLYGPPPLSWGAFLVPLMRSWRPADSLSPQALGDRPTGGNHAGHGCIAPGGAGHPLLLRGRRADAALTKPHPAPPRPRLSQSRSCSLFPITCHGRPCTRNFQI
jgi:hypothetical protein